MENGGPEESNENPGACYTKIKNSLDKISQGAILITQGSNIKIVSSGWNKIFTFLSLPFTS